MERQSQNLYSAFLVRGGDLIWLGASSTREEAREIIHNSDMEGAEYSFVVKTEDFVTYEDESDNQTGDESDAA